MREIGLERGKLGGDIGRLDRGGDRGRDLEREEDRRRRCRGRDDLDLERRRRCLELARAWCGRRDRRSGERGLLDGGVKVYWAQEPVDWEVMDWLVAERVAVSENSPGWTA